MGSSPPWDLGRIPFPTLASFYMPVKVGGPPTSSRAGVKGLGTTSWGRGPRNAASLLDQPPLYIGQLAPMQDGETPLTPNNYMNLIKSGRRKLDGFLEETLYFNATL